MCETDGNEITEKGQQEGNVMRWRIRKT